jgi:hypothetical protein
MRRTAGLLIGRSVVLRLLLVAALAVGLSAMHVLAGVVGQQHAEAHGTLSGTMSGPSVSGVSGGHGHMLVGPAPAAASPTSAAQASDHEHHSAVDCVLFLSAGVALLGILVAWAAARALRPASWPVGSWLKAATAITPWRGPPPWHWPRIHLCVIRV